MNYSSDLIDSDLSPEQSFIAAPEYPSVFGISFTPMVLGIGVAALGAMISIYAFVSYLQPQLAKNQELETKLAQTQEQIQLRKDNDKKIAAAEKERDRATAQKQIVTGLFASDQKLDTLLLDLNKIINIRQGELQTFAPDLPVAGSLGSSGATVVSDGSLGSALNNKVKRKGVKIEVSGNFEQIQSILRTIERLDQLLIIKDFRADVDKSTQNILVDAKGRVVPPAAAKIKTSFKIQAMIPLTAAEATAATPPPAPAKK
jgi:type IV pilus assembly protein PilO